MRNIAGKKYVNALFQKSFLHRLIEHPHGMVGPGGYPSFPSGYLPASFRYGYLLKRFKVIHIKFHYPLGVGMRYAYNAVASSANGC